MRCAAGSLRRGQAIPQMGFERKTDDAIWVNQILRSLPQPKLNGEMITVLHDLSSRFSLPGHGPFVHICARSWCPVRARN